MRWTPFYLANYHMSLVKKEECNSIVKKWQIYFQVSNYKGKYFLDLNDNNNQPIHSTYSKGSTGWNTSAYQTCCMLALQDLLQITLLLMNISQDFSPMYQSHAHTVILLLR